MNDKAISASPNAARAGWLGGVQAGLIAGLIAVIFSISHATLVTGAAAPHATASVIGMALIGTAVLCLLMGAFSGVPGLVPMAQDVPAAAIGAILVTIVADRADDGGLISTAEVVMLCLAAGLFFSLVVFLIGRFRLAGMMRYAPRPVLAGFLAGTGFFILLAAFGICLGHSVTLATVPDLFAAQAWPKLAVALGVAAAFFAAERVLPPSLVACSVIIAALALFFIACASLGITSQELALGGWTAQLPDGGLSWPPVTTSDIAQIDLGFFLGQLFPIATMVLLATAAILMNSSALEARLGEDLRLDRELSVLGTSSFASTVAGGFPGYHGVSTTVAGMRVAGPHRVTSFVAGGLALLVFFWGNEVLSVLPLPILAGFMIWVGSDFLRDWLLKELKAAPLTEGCLTVLIFVVIAAVGLFEGTVFGLVAGSALFIVNYSRLNPVRSTLTGDVYLGAAEHSTDQRRLLEDAGGAILILKLQGYVFFGTAHGLRRRIATQLSDGKVRHLLLDFGAVTGVDATAVESFQRLADALARGQVSATFSDMPASVTAVFARAGLPIGPDCQIGAAPDLDTALAAAQAKLFAQNGHLSEDGAADDIHSIIANLLGERSLAERFVTYLEKVDATKGKMITQVGHEASDIYFLVQGSAEVIVGTADNARRVRTLGPGAIIGEIAYYTEGFRSSSVKAATAATLFRLTSQTAAQVLQQDPELSSALHAGLARGLAARVQANTRLIQMLQA